MDSCKGYGISAKMISITMFMIIGSMIMGPKSTYSHPVDFSQLNFTTSGHSKVLENATLLQLSLDQISNSAFQSKFELVYGLVDIDIKTSPGGPNTEFYFGPKGIDVTKGNPIGFKFVGKTEGQPYIMQVSLGNSNGKGISSSTQNFRLWFNPTKAFNTYSILWNINNIVFYVNGAPISIIDATKIKTPMMVYGSIRWNEAKVSNSGSNAPFISLLRDIKVDKGCIWRVNRTSCNPIKNPWLEDRIDQNPDAMAMIKDLQDKRLIK